MKKPKTVASEMTTLDEVQVKALLAVCKSAFTGSLATVALASGARQGELLALMWPDVDFEKGTISIKKALTRVKFKPVVKEPKNQSSKRRVKLPPFALEALARLKEQAKLRGFVGTPVFCSRDGIYKDRMNVLSAFKLLVKRHNRLHPEHPIPEVMRFHDLRHSHASLLLSKGSSIKAVATRLGHKNANITLKVYSHAMPGDDERLADIAQGLMG